ncbi:hypothetical protein K7432_005425 [Basidiobolus ranarum]|uniref:Uncharacterized protein n=1 Tax=Basidiobolus ranarum TaxID=34480 RepID=A0ABR2W357_9FUNG
MSLLSKSQQTLSRFSRPGFSKHVRYASVLSTSNVPRTIDSTQLTADMLPPQLRFLATSQSQPKPETFPVVKQQRPNPIKAQNVTKAKNALNQIEEVLSMSNAMLKTLKLQSERKDLEHQMLTKQVAELREENRVTRECVERLLCKLNSFDSTISQRKSQPLLTSKSENGDDEQ